MDSITCEIDNGIGRLILNRPSQKNAINRQMWLDLPKCLNQLKDDAAKVVIISGAGKCFSAGADLTELEAIVDKNDATLAWMPIYEALNSVATFPLPLIAAIEGPCLGGGCLLAAACDMRFSTEGATFSIPIAHLGIVLDDDNIGRLTSLIGPAVLKEIIFSGRIYTSEQCLRFGLLNGIHPVQAFAREIDELARQIGKMSMQSIEKTKESIRRTQAGETWGSGNQAPAIDSYVSVEFKERMKRRVLPES